MVNKHLRRGLYEMGEHLTDQQRAFVEAVHACLDKRGAKFDTVKDGFRLKLGAAKTRAVSRSILASFFSEGGGNTFTARGSTVMALVMRAHDWEEVRDLALLAIATYEEGEERKPKGDADPVEDLPNEKTPNEKTLDEKIADFSRAISADKKDVSAEYLSGLIDEIADEIISDCDTAGN